MVETEIITVDPLNPDDKKIEKCANVLKNGGIVAFPTETVYGLGACMYDRNAVRKIFEVKQRPFDNPLIVHIENLKQLYEVAKDVNEKVRNLISHVWPGPLTVILPKKRNVPDIVTAHLDTVAVRMPAHPVALKLIRKLGRPIVAPSANLAGKPSPTTANHVIEDLFGLVDIIIDAGETFLGVESTILNVSIHPPVLLRPGPISVEKLEKLFGEKIIVTEQARGLIESEKAISPGTKYKHYAPRTPLIIVESENYTDLSKIVSGVLDLVKKEIEHGKKVVIIASSETADYYGGYDVIKIGSRKNLYEVAKNLFKVLREVDKYEADICVVEGFDEKGIGLAIMNRLRKASGFNIIKIR